MMRKEKLEKKIAVEVVDESDGNLRVHVDRHHAVKRTAQEDVIAQNHGHHLVPVPAPRGHIPGLVPSPLHGHIVGRSHAHQ